MNSPRQAASIAYSRQCRVKRMWPFDVGRPFEQVIARFRVRSAHETGAVSPDIQTAEANQVANTRILVLGGGFGGVYAALHLEKI